ncbi:nuclear receptor ROR-gamma-like [Spea bombifrons]|uniref:nuclear receptor ROR-gamma-like n=1 Tax=Spea bombifrons TaxID=233779 RepID=UPI00234BEC09|nr:nuclear receptor ROR-gamma-like [Spea bombifrons]
MSRNAVKFGRMSKKQRDILQAEVQKQRLKEQRSEAPTPSCTSDPQNLEPLNNPTKPTQMFPPTTWSSQGRWESPCLVTRNHPLHHHPPAADKPSIESTLRKSYSRDPQLLVENFRPSLFQRLPPTQNPEPYCNLNVGSLLPPECMMSATDMEMLMQSVVCAHQETCQFHLESLQVLRWEIFSPEEVKGFQLQPVDQMWERCVCHITNAIQYIVEFAKRLSGFMELNPNDQIVLLKAGVMEILLIRMSRAFNCYNSTIFFEGKYAKPEIFQSLGCSDLIGSMFDLCHSLCALNLTEQEMALISAIILIDPGRQWLQDRQKVETMHKKLELCFWHLVRRSHRESIIPKLPQKGKILSICHLHLEKLNVFLQMYPGAACERFPPLYKELFLSEPETS